jgi:predicted alpha/beta-hydrolase family hydrolase
MTRAARTQISLANGDAVSGLFDRPANARALLVLAHGAGAGMSHPFLEDLCVELTSAGIATLRYQFPYVEKHRKLPDPTAVLTRTVRAAVENANQLAPDLPLFAGGKSMGGRMTSMTASEQPLGNLRGLVFVGFPLHPPNRPGTKRAEHLARVTVPMLFLQGTRDAFADPKLLEPICANLGSRATLRTFEGADHSFHMLKSSGTNDSAVLRSLVENIAGWIGEIS